MMVRMEMCVLMVLVVLVTITAEMAASTQEADLLARTSHSLKRVETRSTAGAAGLLPVRGRHQVPAQCDVLIRVR